ncbi:hypothetical protein [Streptomyces atratus]|uniref:hypothetical protein n=1 Tax=Streptomyces atratus TaxID=1893 RepID=UPI00130072A2|nr:hypothetical protein [Streptomyces atratus]
MPERCRVSGAGRSRQGTQCAIDLLRDGEAATVVARLAEHPGTEFVCRDRAQ